MTWLHLKKWLDQINKEKGSQCVVSTFREVKDNFFISENFQKQKDQMFEEIKRHYLKYENTHRLEIHSESSQRFNKNTTTLE